MPPGPIHLGGNCTSSVGEGCTRQESGLSRPSVFTPSTSLATQRPYNVGRRRSVTLGSPTCALGQQMQNPLRLSTAGNPNSHTACKPLSPPPPHTPQNKHHKTQHNPNSLFVQGLAQFLQTSREQDPSAPNRVAPCDHNTWLGVPAPHRSPKISTSEFVSSQLHSCSLAL